MTDGTLHREFLSEPDLAAYRYREQNIYLLFNEPFFT